MVPNSSLLFQPFVLPQEHYLKSKLSWSQRNKDQLEASLFKNKLLIAFALIFLQKSSVRLSCQTMIG